MKIFIGTDHGGAFLEEELLAYLQNKGYDAYLSSIVHNDKDDYPDFAFDVCKNVLASKDNVGILLCRSGVGMSIAANKVKGIRAARCVDEEDAYYAKDHNGANVVCIGTKCSYQMICKIIDTFLSTPSASEERHLKRIKKVIDYENGAYNEL